VSDLPYRDDSMPYISTGHLPSIERVSQLLEQAYHEIRGVGEGQVSEVYPALARAQPDLFGVALAAVDGQLIVAGDAAVRFPIMSVAKPFVYALVCEAIGPHEVRRRVGANATGLSFNSAEAVVRSADGRTNAMVNSGAIATTSLLPGRSPDDKWQTLIQGLSGFAGHDLNVDEETYVSASRTNHQNRKLTHLVDQRDGLACDATAALDLYTRQSCLAVSAVDLAIMGATLADGGVNPQSGERVVRVEVCHYVLAAMITAGLYETSGDWLHDVGLPAKSGISGDIITVSPGKGSLATFSPPLDSAGNSVRGTLIARRLSQFLGLDLLTSAPNRSRLQA
jgi:glutaminase